LDEVFDQTTVSPAHACSASVSVLYLAKVVVRVVGWPEAPVPVGAWSVLGGGDIEGGVVGGAAVGACAWATTAVRGAGR
jgi:hypothetical protein